MSRWIELRSFSSSSLVSVNTDKVDYITDSGDGNAVIHFSGKVLTIQESYDYVVGIMKTGDGVFTVKVENGSGALSTPDADKT